VSTPPLIVPNALELEVGQFCDDLFDQLTNNKERERHLKDSLKIIDYLEGKQWSPSARFARSRPVVNKFSRHYWEGIGYLSDLALDFHIKLFDKSSDFDPFEKLLEGLATFWALNSNFDDRTYDVIHYGMMNSGWSKQAWKSSLNGGLGDFEITPIAPWEIAVEGTGNDPKDAECICYYHVESLAQLFRDFGKIAGRVKPDSEYSSGGASLSSESLRPSIISKDTWSKLADPLKKRLLGDSVPASEDIYPKAVKREFWLRDNSVNETSQTVVVGPEDERGEPAYNWCYRVEPGMPLYPRGRVIIQAGGAILADSPNPYWHSQHPFSCFRPFRVPWSLDGISPVAPWRQMQNITNRIYGGVLDMIVATLEPTLIAPKAAFPQGDWEAIDPGAAGGKIKYNNNSPRAPEFVKRGEVPGWVFSYLQEISKEFDMSSGASAMTQALGKKQIPGDDALERIISSRSLPIRVQTKSLTSWVRDNGRMGISNILQFYSMAHRMQILGLGGTTPNDFRPIYGEARPRGVKGEDFVKRFQFIIKPGSTLASERNERNQVALLLQQRGVLSARGLMKQLEPNFDFDTNRQELIEEAKLRILMAGAAAAVTGKGSHKAA
jgi:hypothetical protein